VLEHAQDLHLPQSCLSHNFVILALFKFFDRDDFVCFLVPALQHHAVRTFPHNAEHLVLVHVALTLRLILGRNAERAVRDKVRFDAGSESALSWKSVL
jgi:hypothetical protein